MSENPSLARAAATKSDCALLGAGRRRDRGNLYCEVDDSGMRAYILSAEPAIAALPTLLPFGRAIRHACLPVTCRASYNRPSPLPAREIKYAAPAPTRTRPTRP